MFDSAGIEAYHAYHDLLFENQPPEGGAPGCPTTSGCIDDHSYEDWMFDATDQASQDNVNGTPRILVNGEVLTGEGGGIPRLQDLVAAVMAAGGDTGDTGGPSATPKSRGGSSDGSGG